MFKRKPAISREFFRARRLFKKLCSLSLVKYFLLFLFILLASPAIFFFTLKPAPAGQPNYGTTFSKKYAEQLGLDWKNSYLQILDELGVKNIRLVAYWDESEKDQDRYNFDDVLWQLDEAKKRNVGVIMTIGRKVPRFPECFEPDWWRQIESEDLQNFELFEYIKHAVGTFSQYDNIKIWQVENEPFFPFGFCTNIKKEVVQKEADVVKNIDKRPILIQDSGEGGFWFPSYKIGDYLGISMYRKIWYDFWKIFLGNSVYFQYPLAHWSYYVKANITGVPVDKIIVTELQAEPWGPTINSKLTTEEKNKTMSKQDFISTINYAQKTGFKDLYFWGSEWWLWEKENGNPFYWETAKALFKY